MRAIIKERGFGFPISGECVRGDDGKLYRVQRTNHIIADCWYSFMYVDVEPVGLADVDNTFPASLELEES